MEIENQAKVNKSSGNDNVVAVDKYILITDNKGNREFCTLSSNKVKMGKRNIDLTLISEKKLNSFWEIDQEPREITGKEFFRENICKIILIKLRTKK